MGLDNSFYVKSDKRKIIRDILPEGLVYPFNKDFNEDKVEISYHRKDWGWRNQLMRLFGWYIAPVEQYLFKLEKPSQILRLIEFTARWLDEERWKNEASSIWTYEEIKPVLIRDISNFAIIYGWMINNPDVYLEFYDSY